MRKFRLILIIALLSITAFGGGLLVNAALNSPAKVEAAAKIDSPAASQDFSYDTSADAPDMNTAASPDPSLLMPEDNSMFRAGGLGVSAGPEERGVISSTSNSGNTLMLRNRRVVNLNGQTSVGDANGSISASDLKAGDYIFALGTVQTDKSLQARWILRLPAPPQMQHGQVTSVNSAGSSFQFKTGSITWTANVISGTKISKAGKAATLSDIAVNDQVSVLGTADANAHTIQATLVQDGRPTPVQGNFLNGVVNTIDVAGNSFVVTETVRGPRPPMPNQQPNNAPSTNATQVKVTVNSSTRYIGPNLTSLSDLKAQDHIVVTGDKQADGSVIAKTVMRVPAGGQQRPNTAGHNGGSNTFNGKGNFFSNGQNG